MDDFDRLLALTRAAESCNGTARRFIDEFGDEPQFSRFVTAPGQPYCEPTASSQARQHLGHAEHLADRLQEYIDRWDEAYEALDYVNRVACEWSEFALFDGTTCLSGHEAARNFAAAVLGVYRRVEGFTDIESAFDLARRLSDVRPIPDYTGRIQKEHYAASELVDALPGDAHDVDNSPSQAHQASDAKLFPKGEPADVNLKDCIIKLQTERDGKTADFDILLRFFGGNEDKAEEMQTLIRKARADRVTTLPANTKRAKRTKRSS